MEEERGENGITLGELCRIICKKIWIVLGAAVLVTLVAALLFAFLINPMRSTYEMGFRIVYPGSKDLKYPDGSPFYYQDMITEEYLTAAKASDERFASVNIERMLEKGDIEISLVTKNNNSSASANTVQYLLSVKGSYFASKEVATDFIKALASLPEERVNEIASSADFKLDESVFERASFSLKLDLLADQKANISEQYKTWIELLDSSYRVKLGETSKTLISFASEARSAFDEEDRLRLKLEQYDFHSEDVASERAALADEYEANLRTIAQLKESKSVTTYAIAAPLATTSDESGIEVWFPEPELTTDQKLQKLITRNENIITLLGAYDPVSGFSKDGGTLATELPAFVKELNRQFVELKQTAETASLVSNALYGQESYTRFDSRYAEEEGGTSLIVVALGGFVIGFAIACVVVCFIDYPKYKRAKNQPKPEEAAENEAEKIEE